MRKKPVLAIFLGLFLCAFAACAVWIGLYFADAKEQDELFTELKKETVQQDESSPEVRVESRNYLRSVAQHGRPDEESAIEPAEVLSHDLAALKAKNSDCIGWVSIPGTGIDYPIMWTPEESEKYLRLSFAGEYNDYGVPFLDGRCTPDSGNLILYGHNKFDGTMFTPVIYFNDPEVVASHPKIVVELEDGVREYEVIAGIHTTTDSPIYQFTGEVDAEEFLTAIREEYPALSDIEPTDGMKFVTLSTCEISRPNGRALLIGVSR